MLQVWWWTEQKGNEKTHSRPQHIFFPNNSRNMEINENTLKSSKNFHRIHNEIKY